MTMSKSTIPVLLVTANVGSIFEDPAEMLKIWCEEFLATVVRLDPKFIALHCQEVGGKNYENSMKHVEHFVKLLMASNELRLFDRVRVFLDEDYSSAENFTALGNLYFVHKSVGTSSSLMIWNFVDMKFVDVVGKEVYSGNIESVPMKEKAKFPQDFFPECKWSRKGFMRTRWSLNGTVFDLINIHLFHDASNFIAMEAYPSVYCRNRRRALEHTLQRFHNDGHGKAPYFVFGDFNFRTDTDSVIKKLTEGLTTTRLQNNKNHENTKLHYADDDSKLILTVGKKEFNHLEHQTVFLNPTPIWLKSFDKELEAFDKYLSEYPITFPPSYPFEEKIAHASSYMQTRCPAWCDRVLVSNTAKQLVATDDKVEYGLIGRKICMGDHKPVYLKFDLKGYAGTVQCCNHSPYECLPAICHCCQSFASVTINIVDMSDYLITPNNNNNTTTRTTTIINNNNNRNNNKLRTTISDSDFDSKLLHEPITRDMLLHEPYTPESAESHSPLPLVKLEKKSNNNGANNNNSVIIDDKQEQEQRRLMATTVSPNVLKTRLEHILTQTTKPMKRSVSENVEVITMNENFFRNRAMSEVPKLLMMHRARLKSSASLVSSSTNRLQSHHSSSDEDWFEFDNVSSNDDDNDDVMAAINDSPPLAISDIEMTKNSPSLTNFTTNNNNDDDNHHHQKKITCCCIV